MRRLFTFIITMLLLSTAARSAEGWPANYGGVMLQAFYWDSYDDTKWTNLTAQADELSKYFDLIWVPNAGNCRSQGMGYLPVYWFQNYNSSFGTKAQLLQMIQTYKEKNVGIIEDVVINHKSPLGRNDSWIDFVNETFTLGGETKTVTWSGADICQNDDGGYVKEQGFDVTGANDTGEDFSGARDLDHTGANVQNNCKLYCQFLLQELGFAGFRLDMVKGYGGEYTKIYNEASQPQYCVGEYWDGKDAITNWINKTGKTSAAFDFPMKWQINKAFDEGNWSALNDKGLSGDPYWNQYSVSFIDNHDTGREIGQKLKNNILAANAFLLAMPGTPSIFLKHWKAYKVSIGNMILARKAAGITNTSQITEQGTQDGGYVIKTQGSKGTVLCISGYVQNYNTEGFKLIATGQNFAYFVSNNVNVEGLNTTDEDPGETIEGDPCTVYVVADAAPYLYAWNSEYELNGAWPGKQMTETEVVDGQKFYKTTFNSEGSYNIIFNDGNGNQTPNIEGLTGDNYFTYNGTSGYAVYGEEIATETVVYVEAAQAPYLYAWDGSGDLNGGWPGTKMTETVNAYGKDWWVARFDKAPINIIFNDGNGNQTSDINGISGHCFFTYDGATEYATSIRTVTTQQPAPTTQLYNLAGQRVSPSYKGIVIQNGKKMIQK